MIAAVDLFCGLGGLTHGLALGGISVIAGVDVDPECRFPYEQNNSAKFVEQDVRSLTSDDLCKLWNGHKGHRLLAGCAPCQPFSTYSRTGRENRPDSKWNLLSHFGRLVQETQPEFVTMENVPQLVGHPILESFLAKLEGYHTWHKVVDCKDFGVPQTRKRLVLLASKLGSLDLTAHPGIINDRNPPTVRSAIGSLPKLKAGQVDNQDRLHRACRLSELNLKRIKASKPGGSWRDWDESLIAECHRKKSGETYPSVYGRMEWDAPAPTITTQCFGYGNGRFGHPEQHRAITLREAAILQTFPNSYRFLPDGEEVKFYVLGRLIGNAVPVRLGQAVAHSFLCHEKRLAR